MDLTTLENVKDFLESTDDWGATWDALIGSLVSDISAQAEAYCNRHFEKTTYTEYHDGGGKFIYLKNPPITSITTIKCSEIWDWAGTTAEDSGGYALNAAAGMVQYLWDKWPYGVGCIQAVYIGGYTNLDALPKDLEAAICHQVAYAFNRRKDLGLESIAFPDGSIQKKNIDQWLPDVKKVLNRYRLRRVG